MHAHAQPTVSAPLPDTVQGCRERLTAIRDEITSIRIQIATTDIRRQTEKKSLDPTWFHRAKTALRMKQQEVAQVSAQLARLNAGASMQGRDDFKDALIEVLRAECDDMQWADKLNRARALQRLKAGPHG